MQTRVHVQFNIVVFWHVTWDIAKSDGCCGYCFMRTHLMMFSNMENETSNKNNKTLESSGEYWFWMAWLFICEYEKTIIPGCWLNDHWVITSMYMTLALKTDLVDVKNNVSVLLVTEKTKHVQGTLIKKWKNSVEDFKTRCKICGLYVVLYVVYWDIPQ